MTTERQVDIDQKTIDELIALMQRDGLDRLRVQVGDLELDLRMTNPGTVERVVETKRTTTHSHGPAHAEASEEAPPGVTKVLAPLVGVFYRSPAPGAKAFVEVGDDVVAGNVLCILEAMKLMNEIVSEHTGKIVRICTQDGDLVSLHQELFWIEA